MSKIKDKFLILGSTGFIGKAVVSLLIQKHHKVECFIRETSNRNFFEKSNVNLTFHIGNILDSPSLINAMNHCDIVINCSGLNSFWEPNNKKFSQINIEARKNIAKAVLASGVKKIVEVSTVMAYGFPKKMPFTENSVTGPHTSRYAESKYLGDQILWEFFKDKNLPLVMVYLAAVIGRGDNKDVMKIRRFLNRKVPIMIKSGNKFTYLHVKDAAAAIIKAAKKENNFGEKYLIGNQRLTTVEYFQIISDLSGVPMPTRFIGKNLSLFLARILTAFSFITKKPPLMPIDLIKTVFKDSLIFKPDKAKEELDMKYTPIEIAIKDEIDYIREKSSLNHI